MWIEACIQDMPQLSIHPVQANLRWWMNCPQWLSWYLCVCMTHRAEVSYSVYPIFWHPFNVVPTGFPPPDSVLSYWLLGIQDPTKKDEAALKLHGFMSSLLHITYSKLKEIELLQKGNGIISLWVMCSSLYSSNIVGPRCRGCQILPSGASKDILPTNDRKSGVSVPKLLSATI